MSEEEKTLRNLLAVQEPLCQTQAGILDGYMVGLYNGLAIALGVITGEDPVLYEIKKKDEEEEVEDGISE